MLACKNVSELNVSSFFSWKLHIGNGLFRRRNYILLYRHLHERKKKKYPHLNDILHITIFRFNNDSNFLAANSFSPVYFVQSVRRRLPSRH